MAAVAVEVAAAATAAARELASVGAAARRRGRRQRWGRWQRRGRWGRRHLAQKVEAFVFAGERDVDEVGPRARGRLAIDLEQHLALVRARLGLVAAAPVEEAFGADGPCPDERAVSGAGLLTAVLEDNDHTVGVGAKPDAGGRAD